MLFKGKNVILRIKTIFCNKKQKCGEKYTELNKFKKRNCKNNFYETKITTKCNKKMVLGNCNRYNF